MPANRLRLLGSLDLPSLAVEQLGDEAVYRLRYAGLGERGADKTAGALKLHAFGEFHLRGDLLGMRRSLGEGEMQLILSVKGRASGGD